MRRGCEKINKGLLSNFFNSLWLRQISNLKSHIFFPYVSHSLNRQVCDLKNGISPMKVFVQNYCEQSGIG